MLYCPVLFPDDTRWYVRAKGTKACGDLAKLENEDRMLDKWFRVDDLLRKKRGNCYA